MLLPAKYALFPKKSETTFLGGAKNEEVYLQIEH